MNKTKISFILEHIKAFKSSFDKFYMIKTSKLLILLGILYIVLFSSLASAMIIDNVDQDTLYPGEYTTLGIDIKNTLNYDVDDVSLTLLFTEDSTKALQFSPIGSSEDSIDEIQEDDKEKFSFKIKAANNLEPGNYNIPFELVYFNSNNTKFTKTGAIGIQVNSKINLDFIASADNPVLNEKGKLTLKIINQGIGEIKFLSVTVQPSGYRLLSENKVYIGSVSSDDYQTADFEVIFNKLSVNLIATVQYEDFENNAKTQVIEFPIKVYSQKDAISAGIKQPSKSWMIIVIIVIIVIFFIYRRIRKNKKAKAKQSSMNNIG